MSEDRKYTEAEDNSFFDGDYRDFTQRKNTDSCATGTITLDDITLMYGFEQTAMLKDYETAEIRMPGSVRSRREKTDRRISELSSEEPEEVRSNYKFDPDDLTIGDLIAINEEILNFQKSLEEEPKDPYLSSLISVNKDSHTEEIQVVSVPEGAIALDESPFIGVDDL